MFRTEDWPQHLRQRLTQPLPGLQAQMKMAPATRRAVVEQRGFTIPPDARQSAVLILLYPGAEGLSIPLIERNAYEGVHSRQISLPGGQVEPHDTDHIATAVREANEEVGIDPGRITILGQLSPIYIPPSNFLVQPVLATAAQRPAFTLDPGEVASLIETPLAPLVHGHFTGTGKVDARGAQWEVPGFHIRGHLVWGATAMILSELIDVVQPLLADSQR